MSLTLAFLKQYFIFFFLKISLIACSSCVRKAHRELAGLFELCPFIPPPQTLRSPWSCSISHAASHQANHDLGAQPGDGKERGVFTTTLPQGGNGGGGAATMSRCQGIAMLQRQTSPKLPRSPSSFSPPPSSSASHTLASLPFQGSSVCLHICSLSRVCIFHFSMSPLPSAGDGIASPSAAFQVRH